MIKAWVSDRIIDNGIFGWVLDPDDTSKIINVKVSIGGLNYYLRANERRSKPKKFLQHKYNGFRIKITHEDMSLLSEGDYIIVYDDSQQLLYKTRLKDLLIPSDVTVNKETYDLLKNSQLFSSDWYKTTYSIPDGQDPIAHYIRIGWKVMYDPSPLFSTFGYNLLNRDIFKAKVNPLEHYCKQLKKNKERPIATVAEVSKDSFISDNFDDLSIVINSPLFDYRWYLSHYIHVEINPNISRQFAALHYLLLGWKEHFDPSKDFSTDYYLSTNLDVAMAKKNPLYHYEKSGRREMRISGPSIFDLISYRYNDTSCTNDERVDVDVFIIIRSYSEDNINRTIKSVSYQKNCNSTIYLVNLSNADELLGLSEKYNVLNSIKDIANIIKESKSYFTFLRAGDYYLDSDYYSKSSSVLSKTKTDVVCGFVDVNRSNFVEYYNAVIYNDYVFNVCSTENYYSLLRFSALFFSYNLSNQLFLERIDDNYDLDLWLTEIIKKNFNTSCICSQVVHDIPILPNCDEFYKKLDFSGYENYTLASLLDNKQDIQKYSYFNSLNNFKKEKYFFSIIIPTWNRGFCIKQCLEHVLDQTYSNYEIIIIDDGSTDNTKDVIFNNFTDHIDSGKIRYFYQKNSGVSAARNKGLSKAKGNWICYVDSDNYVSSNYLKTFAFAINSNSSYKFFYAKLISIYSGLCVGTDFDRENLLKKNYIDMGILCHSIDLYHKYGGFDENLKKCVDWDLVLKYTSYCIPKFIDQIVLYYNDDQSFERISNTEKPSFNKSIIQSKYSNCKKYPLVHRFNSRLKDIFSKKQIISIKDPSPFEERFQWGDYWFANDLKFGLNELGYRVRIDNREYFRNSLTKFDDVEINIRGLCFYAPTNEAKSILYIISHPELILDEEITLYDAIACASLSFTNILRNKFPKKIIEFVPQFSNSSVFYSNYDSNCKHDLLFVGNTRKVFRDSVKYAIKNNFDISVYGNGWNEFIDERFIKGTYINNRELSKYYSSAKIVLNDHYSDMKQYGFVSNRIFDVTFCGGFIVSDYQEDIKTIFKGSIPTYKNEKEFCDIVSYFLDPKHDKERLDMAKEAQRISLNNFSIEKISESLSSIIERIHIN